MIDAMHLETDKLHVTLIDGPVLDDNDGNTDPIQYCLNGACRCRHLLVNDHHYFWCLAQSSDKDSSPYPVHGKKLYLYEPKPNKKCPYIGKGEDHD